MVTEAWFRTPDDEGTTPFLLDPTASSDARQLISNWPFYRPSPLRQLDRLATQLGVARIQALDESRRLPLKSFKMLGAVYAVTQVVARETRGQIPAKLVFNPEAGENTASLMGNTRLVAASDGNHGRALAWVAHKLGVDCAIYLPLNVSRGREQRIQDYGADTIRISGNYDAAVNKAHQDAIENGWIIIQDTVLEGFEDCCLDIMHGYTMLAHEAMQQFEGQGGRIPSHVFVQAGVGGFAGATASYLASRFGKDGPVIVVVESVLADCVMTSLKRGSRTAVGGSHDTKMVGIACGEVSEIAWSLLRHLTDCAVTIDDSQALQTLRLMVELNPQLEIGETGVAGLAGIQAVCLDPELRDQLGIDEQSDLLAFITEGITDEDSYRTFIHGQ